MSSTHLDPVLRLVVLHDTAQRALGGSQGAVEHVHVTAAATRVGGTLLFLLLLLLLQLLTFYRPQSLSEAYIEIACLEANMCVYNFCCE